MPVLLARRMGLSRFIFMLMLCAPLAHAEIDLVKVVKSKQKMYLLEGSKVVKEYRAVFGANPKGHKQQEGDKKTPEGVYILDYKKEDSSFYRAMHISYPNEMDTENALKKGVSPGGLIMVHGQPNGLGLFASTTQKFNWTNGCIALNNSDIDEFMSLIDIGTTIHIEW